MDMIITVAAIGALVLWGALALRHMKKKPGGCGCSGNCPSCSSCNRK